MENNNQNTAYYKNKSSNSDIVEVQAGLFTKRYIFKYQGA